jgi:hypothetical protein
LGEDGVALAGGTVVDGRTALFGWGLGLVMLAGLLRNTVFANKSEGIIGVTTLLAGTDATVEEGLNREGPNL